MKIQIPSGFKGKQLFDFLSKNKQEIIDAKKSIIKQSDLVCELPRKIISKTSAIKEWLYENDEDKGIVKRSIVMNSYNWLDSHDDVHIDGLFAKSLSERAKRIPHLHDHIQQLTAKVGVPIAWKELEIDWKSLGVDIDGNTMILLLESEIKKALNEDIYNAYKNDEIDQHSVGMRYINLSMAYDDEDYKEEYAVWKAYIDRIGNKEKAIKQGYFFAIKEAALIEGSAVLFGSNEITPVLNNNKFQPGNSTEIKEPHIALNVEKLLGYYKV